MISKESRARETKTGILGVRRIRGRPKYTQRQVAAYCGIPVATLRHWERGNRRPAGPALVLLHVIADNPRAMLQAVRKARTRSSDVFGRIEPPRSFRAPPGQVAHYWRGG